MVRKRSRVQSPPWAPAQGMNPVQLAEIVGPTSLALTQQVYSPLSPSDAYDAMAKLLIGRRD